MSDATGRKGVERSGGEAHEADEGLAGAPEAAVMSSAEFDAASTDAFADRVDGALDRGDRVSSLWPLVGGWLVAGAVLTLAEVTEEGWIYVAGLVLTVACLLGFWAARGAARWFGW